MSYEWQENLKIGDERLDSQHRELFDAFNRLLDACSMGTSQTEIKETLAFLEQYIDFHFEEEEALMAQMAYPDLHSHKCEHNRFRRQVESIMTDYQQNGASIPLVAKANSILSSWLITHVKQEDFKLVIYLKPKQPSASAKEKGDL